ncbi:SusC/RagA family TonB-linked outer membrane protein [Puia sp. P3]|uniref:SusC/RagA family TonB-linked outer membrane protein n=1 Tax=Puia sp. P3 TaxID=3423952 RepID=UPI003D675292
MEGVTVYSRQEEKATVTDSSGSYSLEAKKGDILTVSFVGYREKQIKVGDLTHTAVALEVNPSNPEQVVVVGYGSSRRKDLTGGVSVVNIKGMDALPFFTVDNALAGQAAGVDVTKTDGTPGGMVRVRIRGASSLLGGNDPLYVVDGIPVQVRNNFIMPGYQIPTPLGFLTNVSPSVTNGVRVALPASFVNSLNSLSGPDPDDIESITILKDASSAAIYGAKAANGVVIITTKTGRSNTPPSVQLSYSSVVSTPYRTPKLLNASQYRTLITEAAQNAFMDDTVGGPPYFHLGITDSVLKSQTWFGTANTAWIKQVTRTTFSNHVGLSISGGGQTSKYFASIAYNNTPGIVDNTNYRRISGKFNLENQIGSRIRIAANLLAGFTSQDIGDGEYTQALLARPDLAPRDAAGNLSNFNHWLAGATAETGLLNPAALLTATNNSKTVNLLGTLSAGYTISRALSFRSAVSINTQSYNQRNYVPGDIEVLVAASQPSYTRGVSSEGNSRLSNWLLENTLSYHKQFTQKHVLNVVVGQSYESSKYSWFTATGGGFQNNNFTNLSSADTMLHIGGDEPKSPQSYLLSFYARTNYSYADKYLVTFTGRADGSSKFGSDKLYGYFPSGALAWRISRESFLSRARWLTDLKIRGSYGLTGNQNIGDQTKHTLYTSVTYGGSSGLIPTILGNEIVEPEITKSADIGMDISLFQDRLYATMDYYNRHTSNAILSLPISPSSTYPILAQNAAGIRNRGFELRIGGDIVRSRNVKWSMTVNVTWNKSLVTDLSSTADLTQITSASGSETTGQANGLQSIGTWGNTALIKGQPLGLITGSYITGIIKSQAEAEAYRHQTGDSRRLTSATPCSS